MSKSVTRRGFLKATALGGAAASITFSGTQATGQSVGASDRIRMAVCGINGRGRTHINEFGGKAGVEISYLVDPDSRLFSSRSEMVRKKGGNKPMCVQDLRKILDDDNLDAVAIASTNSTHALLGIWACQAGKDVYIEKPCSHNVFEGRKLVEAARKNKCIVQHGTQRRSEGGWHKQVAAAASGKYGKLLISYGWASKPRRSIGFKKHEQPPKGLDFNLWLGPVRDQPYHGNLVHYNWHWFWDFGNGEIGNQGVHQMDVARWAITAATGLVGPKTVISMGGRYGYKDQAQTPNTQLTIYDFGGVKLIFEDYGLVTGRTRKVSNEFITDQGVIRGGKFYPKGSNEGESLKDVEYQCYPGGNFGNFITCVRSRKQRELNGEILEGHLSAALCHLGNISYQLGQQVPFTKKAPGDKDCLEAFEGMKEHLKDHTDMELSGSTYKLGRKLTYDVGTEQFVGDAEANALLTRQYRKPFVVPEQV